MDFDLSGGEEGPVNHTDHRGVGRATLDACRDAANEWVFPEAGPRATDIRDAYVATVGAPTHFVDVTDTIDAGVASLREHRAYIEGLGREFDPDEFLKNMAGYVGLGAGCEYAAAFRRYPMGRTPATRAAIWASRDRTAGRDSCTSGFRGQWPSCRRTRGPSHARRTIAPRARPAGDRRTRGRPPRTTRTSCPCRAVPVSARARRAAGPRPCSCRIRAVPPPPTPVRGRS